MTKRTLREIAEAMYARFIEIEGRNGRTDMPPWPDLNEKAQAEWFELAEAGIKKAREIGL